MKIRITFDVDANTRRAIGHRVGNPSATYDDCRRIIEGLVNADLEVIVSDYEQHKKERESF